MVGLLVLLLMARDLARALGLKKQHLISIMSSSVNELLIFLPGRVGGGSLLEFRNGHGPLPDRRVWRQGLVKQLRRDKVAKTDLQINKELIFVYTFT